ncbi:RNA polymerase sigma factor [Flavobacterium sp. W1B]|uniref:RNA polymerase sigma factor n=1 Tax=Flavobacterium sp. W1B TaxID=3394146 RepID=UPI0039BD55BD
MTEKELLIGCQKQDITTQNLVYKTYGPKVFGICKRYMKSRELAEEITMNSFLTVFQKCHQFKNEGSFEGWILKITVNCCLMELRKNNLQFDDTAYNKIITTSINEIENHIENQDIKKMLKILPDSARVIFNLYAIEGYKHREIAEKLNISDGTSKSQLNYAREKLKEVYFKNRK